MKRISAILLMALFLFNLAGYRLLFSYIELGADHKMEIFIDKHGYNEEDLVLIKIPLSLPYITEQAGFERISGEITVNGKILQYVKRKVSGGSLILICLLNPVKMQIASEKDAFFRYSNDIVQNNHSKKPTHSKSPVFKNLTVEYDLFTTEYSFFFNHRAPNDFMEAEVDFLPSSPYDSLDQPPESLIYS